VDEHQERARRNEILFRSVNEQLENLNAAFAVTTPGGFEIVCECGEGACVEQIPISSADYSRIRSDPTLFILVGGHEDPTVEAVVEEDQPYLVVRKPPGSTAGLTA
jgi:hypothetical protein